MADYNNMSRDELIEELKKLRKQELDIKAEAKQWADSVCGPIIADIEEIRDRLREQRLVNLSQSFMMHTG